LLFTACAAPAVATPAPVVDEPTAAPDLAPASNGAYPVTIEHKYGSTTITDYPERIVVVGLNEQDSLLALGVVPVATTEWYGERPGAIFEWGQDELAALGGETPLVMPGVEIDFETVASMDPDAIIALYSGITEQEYELLAQIAPTVAQPAEYIDWGIPWQDVTLTVGKILGKNAEAEALVQGVEDQFTAIRAKYPEFQGTEGLVATAYGYPTSFYVFSSQDIRGRLFESLGFQLPAVIDELAGADYGASISLERFDLIDVDLVVWVDVVPPELLANPLYTGLDVVKDGRVLYIDSSDTLYDALNFATVLSLSYAIERMDPMLEDFSKTLQGN
jgi:iron complex transport system substrate-binding protein